MSTCIDYVKTGDTTQEKHVPAIDAPDKVKAGEAFEVKYCVGRDIAHPNTPTHYIAWIKLLFKPDNAEKPVVELADAQFSAHQEGTATEPAGSVRVKLSESGTLVARSYCNIHGLWGCERKIAVE